MWRNGSRAVTTKQALMADQTSLLSPSQNHPTPICSFFVSPWLVNGFLAKSPIETETKRLVCDKNKSNFPKNFSGNKYSWEKFDPKGIGPALVDSLNERTDEIISQPNNRMILFGSELKVQIPPPKSPADFRSKTQNSQFLDSSSPFGSMNSSTTQKNLSSPRVLVGCLSASEIELSEEYTCVISHRPKPKITHSFDNCVVENCYVVVRLPGLER